MSLVYTSWYQWVDLVGRFLLSGRMMMSPRSDCCDNSGVMPSAGYDGCFRLSAWKVDFHVNMLRSRQDGGQDWTGPADWHSRETESGSTFTRQLTERSDSALSSSQTLDQFQRVLLTCTDTKFAMCCKICFFINICPNFPLGTDNSGRHVIDIRIPSILSTQWSTRSEFINFLPSQGDVCDESFGNLLWIIQGTFERSCAFFRTITSSKLGRGRVMIEFSVMGRWPPHEHFCGQNNDTWSIKLSGLSSLSFWLHFSCLCVQCYYLVTHVVASKRHFLPVSALKHVFILGQWALDKQFWFTACGCNTKNRVMNSKTRGPFSSKSL